MQRHLVLGIGYDIHGLHDIDLAIRGPVRGVGEPEGGPCCATDRGVDDIEDKEAGGPLSLGLDAHGEAASGGIGHCLCGDGRVHLEYGR